MLLWVCPVVGAGSGPKGRHALFHAQPLAQRFPKASHGSSCARGPWPPHCMKVLEGFLRSLRLELKAVRLRGSSHETLVF